MHSICVVSLVYLKSYELCHSLYLFGFQESPFVLIRNQRNLTGNMRFEGFCVDLLESISEMVGFNYEIRISGEGMYGVLDMETNQWNGLVKDLMDKVSQYIIFKLLLRITKRDK